MHRFGHHSIPLAAGTADGMMAIHAFEYPVIECRGSLHSRRMPTVRAAELLNRYPAAGTVPPLSQRMPQVELNESVPVEFSAPAPGALLRDRPLRDPFDGVLELCADFSLAQRSFPQGTKRRGTLSMPDTPDSFRAFEPALHAAQRPAQPLRQGVTVRADFSGHPGNTLAL